MKELSRLSIEYMMRYEDLKYAEDQFVKERKEIIDEVRKFIRAGLIKSGISASAIEDYDYDKVRTEDHITSDNWGCLISRKYKKFAKNDWASGIGIFINPVDDEWKCGYNPHIFFRRSKYLSDPIIGKIEEAAKKDNLTVIQDGGFINMINHVPAKKGINIKVCLEKVKKFPSLFIKYDNLIAKYCK